MSFIDKEARPLQYDVFNGDADGICALHQLRLAFPTPSARLVTGVKRDIHLLDRLQAVAGSSITVLDISLHSNRSALDKLLAADNEIVYIDHHFAGDVPSVDNLECHIDPAPDKCTSLLVNNLLEDRFVTWALCGAFGDNLHGVAADEARRCSLTETEVKQLREIGELLNYNGYGADLSDLYFPPDQLFLSVNEYESPFDFFDHSEDLRTLRLGFANDMELAAAQPVFATSGKNVVYRFPDSPWARRVSGVFANLKARHNPDGAHALITENHDETLRISVRAPLNDRRDADALCRAFPTGGGRAAAAGINGLPAEQLDSFLEAFNQTYR